MSFESDLSARARIGVEAARCAGDLLRELREQLGPEMHKGAVNLVTEADLASQDYLEGAITDAFGADSFVAEESNRSIEGGSGYRWIVDPLDGTTNYVHGYAPYGVSVGLHYDGRAVFGCVYLIPSDELFMAIKGRGARCNGRAIHVSVRDRLSDSLLATGFPYDRRERADELLSPVRRAMQTAHGIRRSGSAAADLCFVARGHIDGFWEPGLAPWDLAAGCLLVEEAGGRVTNYDGGPHDLQAGRTVASNGIIHQELIDRVVRGSETA